jgi:biopolymer transport protein ExbD
MSRSFTCPKCRHEFGLSPHDRTSGTVKCPKCNKSTILTAEERRSEKVHSPAEFDDAPLSRPGQHIDQEELIDMTAMVDIVFFLLIFFLVTSMHSLSSTIPLPSPDAQKGSGAGLQTLQDFEESADYVVVNIDRNDAIQVDGLAVGGPDDLLLRLKEIRRDPNGPDKMLVVGHGDASHGAAVMVLDAGHEAGMERVRMSIQSNAD